MAKGYKPVYKRVTDLNIGEMTWCKHSGRYNGVSIGRDDDGYFARRRARGSNGPEDNPTHRNSGGLKTKGDDDV